MLVTPAHLEGAGMPTTAREWFCAKYGRYAVVALPTLLRDVAELPDGYRWVGRLRKRGMVPQAAWDAFQGRRHDAEVAYAAAYGTGVTAARCGYRRGMQEAVLCAAEALEVPHDA